MLTAPHTFTDIQSHAKSGGYTDTAITKLDYHLNPVEDIHDNGYLVIENAYTCIMFHVYDRYLFQMFRED